MTYHQIIDDIFDYCVELLIIAARAIGMTYEEINVWFFIVFEPLVFFMVLLYALRLKIQNHHLKKQYQIAKSFNSTVINEKAGITYAGFQTDAHSVS